MIKTLSKQKRPLSKRQLAEYRFNVLENGLRVLDYQIECINQDLTREICDLQDLIETLIEKIEGQNVK